MASRGIWKKRSIDNTPEMLESVNNISMEIRRSETWTTAYMVNLGIEVYENKNKVPEFKAICDSVLDNLFIKERNSIKIRERKRLATRSGIELSELKSEYKGKRAELIKARNPEALEKPDIVMPPKPPATDVSKQPDQEHDKKKA